LPNETCIDKTGVVKSSQQKPETTSPAVIISSIGVLQIKEKHSNGIATSLEVLPRNRRPSITILNFILGLKFSVRGHD
jgi:hypothetical protein